MKEKKLLETELQEYTDQILILEVKIEVSEEKMDDFREKIREKKIVKDNLFSARDELITEKRILQKEKFAIELDSQKDQISLTINNLSDKIGDVIETSKSLSNEIQEMYDDSQVEYKNITSSRTKLKSLQRESNQKILSFKRKIAEIDNDLNNLRSKMSEIQDKLNKNR